jgi:hypothetical protein
MPVGSKIEVCGKAANHLFIFGNFPQKGDSLTIEARLSFQYLQSVGTLLFANVNNLPLTHLQLTHLQTFTTALLQYA